MSALNFMIHTIALILGASIGTGVSFIVNCTLIEISKNRFFAYVRLFNIVFFSILCNNRHLYLLEKFEKCSKYFSKPRLYTSQSEGAV
jgi:hypothetical protein